MGAVEIAATAAGPRRRPRGPADLLHVAFGNAAREVIVEDHGRDPPQTRPIAVAQQRLGDNLAPPTARFVVCDFRNADKAVS